MGTPVATSQDLATYLGVDVVDPRMTLILTLAQNLCETVVSPCPPEAEGVVLDVAARAYNNAGSASTLGLATGHVGYTAPTGYTVGGLSLTRANRRDLLSFAGRSGAFSINLLPSGYSLDLPFWDEQ